jgi:acyl carrier protein
MAPDAILALAEIPRLPNGKIDKNALPEPASASAKAGAPQPFSSAIELLLGEIWRDVLGVEAVRGHDNFFDLGGNSLAAIQVVARAQHLFGKEIPVSAIFEGSDLAAVAAAIQAQVRLDVDDDVDALLAEIESSPANV